MGKIFCMEFQIQLKDETENIQVLRFGAVYIRNLTAWRFSSNTKSYTLNTHTAYVTEITVREFPIPHVTH